MKRKNIDSGSQEDEMPLKILNLLMESVCRTYDKARNLPQNTYPKYLISVLTEAIATSYKASDMISKIYDQGLGAQLESEQSKVYISKLYYTTAHAILDLANFYHQNFKNIDIDNYSKIILISDLYFRKAKNMTNEEIPSFFIQNYLEPFRHNIARVLESGYVAKTLDKIEGEEVIFDIISKYLPGVSTDDLFYDDESIIKYAAVVSSDDRLFAELLKLRLKFNTSDSLLLEGVIAKHSLPLVKYIIKNKQPQLEDHEFSSILSVAQKAFRNSSDENIEFITDLAKTGANPKWISQDDDGIMALLLGSNDTRIVMLTPKNTPLPYKLLKTLLEIGCGFEFCDDAPLVSLMNYNNIDSTFIELFVKHGADVNIQSASGHTALTKYFARILNHDITHNINVIKSLVEAGANVNYGDNLNRIKYPLYSARVTQNEEIFNYIFSRTNSEVKKKVIDSYLEDYIKKLTYEVSEFPTFDQLKIFVTLYKSLDNDQKKIANDIYAKINNMNKINPLSHSISVLLHGKTKALVNLSETCKYFNKFFKNYNFDLSYVKNFNLNKLFEESTSENETEVQLEAIISPSFISDGGFKPSSVPGAFSILTKDIIAHILSFLEPFNGEKHYMGQIIMGGMKMPSVDSELKVKGLGETADTMNLDS